MAASGWRSERRRHHPARYPSLDVTRLVDHCVNELRNVSERHDPSGYGLDAKLAIIVSMGNVELASTAFVERSPAPQVGDPLHYDSFLQRICEQYRQRFVEPAR